MKNILVVGGAGYIGGAVTDALMENDYNIRVYDSLVYEESYRKPIDFYYGDIREHEKVLKQLNWADAVIWLAGLVGDGACAINPEVTIELNQNSLQWLSQNFDGRIIYPSTCSVYGAQDGELTEESEVNPLSVYAVTKYESEKFLDGKDSIIFRLGTIFGVGDLYSRIRLDLVVNILTVRAALEKKLTVYGGDQFRPLLHVKDVARAMVQNIETGHTGVYNLARQNVRIIDLAYQVRNHFPDAEMKHTDMKFQDSRNYRVSAQRAMDVLGFNPIFSIDDGINEMKHLIETRRIKDVTNPRYSNQLYLTQYAGDLGRIG